MKKTIKKDKILKWTAVFIIATAMVISTTAVTANISSINTKRSESNIGPIGDILLDEGFEDGVMPPPGGWTATLSNPDYTWEIVDAASEPDLVHMGDYAAVVRWCGITYQDELLISPEIDLTPDYGSANLSFWVNCWTLVSGATLRVYVENNGDGINHKIWDMQEDENWPDNPPFYRQVDLSILEFVGNTVNIKWHYDGMGLVCDLGLDDILVYTGEPPDPPEIEIGEIKGNAGTLSAGAIISAEIKNVGDGNATDVEWVINVTGSGVFRKIKMNGSGTIAELLAGNSEIVQTEPGNPTKVVALGKVFITVTASESKFGTSDLKNATGLLIGWKTLFIREV